MTLTRIVGWGHQLAREILRQGDLALDLTAGKGQDTCMLAGAVGADGRVVAFDIQADALAAACSALDEKGFSACLHPLERPLPKAGGVFLVHACHALLDTVIREPLRVAIANLGYLPGGDKEITTSVETTLDALDKSLALLQRGGRLLVTVYPGHPGGAEEADAVCRFLTQLPSAGWQVLQVSVANHGQAPFLLAAERKR